MKNVFKMILKESIYRLPFHILELLEVKLARAQGKGWGGVDSLAQEVDTSLKLLDLGINDAITVLDVGACHGDWTTNFLLKSPMSKVYAFEPNAQSFIALDNRFKGDFRVKVENVALWSSVTQVDIYENPEKPFLTSNFNRKLPDKLVDENSNVQRKIVTTTIDEYCLKNGVKPTLIKLDVEGAELEVLKGATNTLKFAKVVEFEFGGANVDSRTFFRDFWEFFRSAEFTLHRMTPNGTRTIGIYSEDLEYFSTTYLFAVNSKFWS